MIAARFRIELPPDTWIAEVSQAVPEATFRLLSGVQTETTAIELGEALTEIPEVVVQAMADQASIVNIEIIEQTDSRVLAKYETTDTGLYEFVAGSALPFEYPVVVENGWYELDLTCTRDEFDQFTRALNELGRPYELLSIVHDEDATGLLTDRQHEVLTTALREGYFTVPRECTLADVAAELAIDKSTASRILRRGQIRIVQWFLTTEASVPSQR